MGETWVSFSRDLKFITSSWLRPSVAGLWVTKKVPKPTRRTSSFFFNASVIELKTASIADLASVCLIPAKFATCLL